MALESEAVFFARLKAVGLGDEVVAKFREKGWTTLGAFAFSSSYTPGQTDDAPFKEVLRAVLAEPEGPQAALVRRVFFEAYTMAAADLKKRIEKTDEDPPRRLPVAERSARHEKIAARLVGLHIEGELEPSHALVDKFVQMVEDGVLRYVPWNELTKREAELLGQKKVREWRADSAGVLHEHINEQEEHADVGTDLRLRFGLQRRSLALEIAGLCSFETAEGWTDLLLREYLRDPPPGYSRVSLAQLQRADQELFRRLAQATRSGLAPAGDKLPLEDLLPSHMVQSGVQMLLLPLPAGSLRSQPAASSPEGDAAGRGSGPGKRKRAGATRNREEPKKPRGGDGGAPRKQTGPRMPKGLIGMCSVTPEGTPICYGWNLGTCKGTKAGEKCLRGLHVCCLPKCFQPHSLADCPDKKKS